MPIWTNHHWTQLKSFRTKTKFPHDDALAVAMDLCDLLMPICLPDRLMICGSVRRLKPEVGDIEIV